VVPVHPDEAGRDAELGVAQPVVVAGGHREALTAALQTLDSDVVVIHDPCRPFATADLIRRVIAGLGSADAAVAAVPVSETLKLVDGDRVVETVARTDLWHPQTPQAFRTDVLRGALAVAEGRATEVEAVRAAGSSIVLVPGSNENIRIDSSDDLKLARAIAKARL
jgi:2-C-methyl-D-erythritol 4-phosphate cytidylyltransferase